MLFKFISLFLNVYFALCLSSVGLLCLSALRAFQNSGCNSQTKQGIHLETNSIVSTLCNIYIIYQQKHSSENPSAGNIRYRCTIRLNTWFFWGQIKWILALINMIYLHVHKKKYVNLLFPDRWKLLCLLVVTCKSVDPALNQD